MLPLSLFGRLKPCFRRGSVVVRLLLGTAAVVQCGLFASAARADDPSGIGAAASLEHTLIDVIRRVEPSVVSIARVRPNSGVGRLTPSISIRKIARKSIGRRIPTSSRTNSAPA